MWQKWQTLFKDIVWTYQVPPNTWWTGSLAVGRLLYWHAFLKHRGEYWYGDFQGMKFLYDLKSDGAAQAYIIPDDDYHFQTFLKHSVPKGGTMIDVGANVGTETVLGLRQGATVHAFEPTLRPYNNLVINVLLNDLATRCHTQAVAVSNKNGSIEFHVQTDGIALTNSIIPGKNISPTTTRTVTVPTVTLDSYLKAENVDHVDLLKVDVEGAERLVFEGASQSLKRGLIKAIFWESNQQASFEERQKTLDLLSSYNYQHFTLDLQTQRLKPWNQHHDCISIHTSMVKKYSAQRFT